MRYVRGCLSVTNDVTESMKDQEDRRQRAEDEGVRRGENREEMSRYERNRDLARE